MHEFSLAMNVVELAEREAKNHSVLKILEIEIEVGDLSGVEPETFQSALEIVVEKTLLEKTLIRITRIQGRGICGECNKAYEMKERLALCPDCNGFPSEITGGTEFRVVSLLAE
jgi:hydrogenase nickel incorporation protein HypA/HybF